MKGLGRHFEIRWILQSSLTPTTWSEHRCQGREGTIPNEMACSSGACHRLGAPKPSALLGNCLDTQGIRISLSGSITPQRTIHRAQERTIYNPCFIVKDTSRTNQMTRHKERSWGGSRIWSSHVFPRWHLDTSLLARRCLRRPGSSPALQCPELSLEFAYLCTTDLMIGHVMRQNSVSSPFL